MNSKSRKNIEGGGNFASDYRGGRLQAPKMSVEPLDFLRDRALVFFRELNMNNSGEYLPTWTYNISTESVFHTECRYAIIQSKIYWANVLKLA